MNRYPNYNKYLYSPQQMTGLYISDNEEKGTIPRLKYTPSCGQIASTIPKTVYQRPAQRPQPQRGRAGSLDYDSESSSSPQMEHKDLKSRMRALMEAANGKNTDSSENDADKYVSNRAKLREQAEQASKVVNHSKDNKNKPQSSNFARRKDDEKVDRKAAMDKISQTFGYGEGTKVKPAPLLTAKERQAEKKEAPKTQTSSKTIKQNTSPDIQEIRKNHQRNQEKKKVAPKPKMTPKSEKESGTKGVEKWDFASKPAKKTSGLVDLDSSIDPELDLMLAELETDEDFKKLNDNDQLTW